MDKISKLFTYGPIDKEIINNYINQQANDKPLSVLDSQKNESKQIMKNFVLYLQQPQMHFELIKQNFNNKQKSMLDYYINTYQQINDLPIYNSSMPIVSSLISFIDNSLNYAPVLTTGDGNCFYNAISIILFGHEGHSSRLRITNAYVLSLYEQWFTFILIRSGSNITIKQLVEQTCKDKVWANEYNILAMSIVLKKPICIYQHHGNSISFASYDIINNLPICLILNNFHFTALLKRISTYNFPVINCNNNQFLRFISKDAEEDM